MNDYTPPEITRSLSNIAMIMSEGDNFLRIRFICEKWEKEAIEGNKDSATLIELITKFERLVTLISKKNII